MNDVIHWNDAAYINWTTDTGVELKIENAWDWLVFCDVFVNRCYPLQLQTSNEKYTATIVDIGANVGYFSLYAEHICRKFNQKHTIYAFEAMPDTFNTLVERVYKYTNIIPLEYAIGKKDGVTNITLSENHGTSFTVDYIIEYPHVTVCYEDLNKLVPPGTIDVLKCDIEGSEYDFVYNYPELLKRTQIVYMEIHYRHSDTLESRGGEETTLRTKMCEYGFNGHKILVNHETASVEVFYRQ